jgi:hypothetical protein
MFAGCAINGGFDGGAEAVEQQKVAIVEIVGEAHQAKAAKPETGLQAHRQTRGATEIATLNAPGTAVIVSTAIAISEHFTFPNDIAVSVTMSRAGFILRAGSALAHKSTYRSERNLTVTALESSDGSIPVEAKAEARDAQAPPSMGVGYA